MSEEVKETVRNHIRRFPRRPSHYSVSKNMHREYLAETLSIAEMYRLYVEQLEKLKCDGVEKPVVSEWMYRKMFQ